MGMELMLDGNAAAGTLQEVFGAEMTANPARCAHCGRVSMIGAMLAFGQQMGTVLRCPHCLEMVMRVMAGPDAVWLDLRGASHLRLLRAP
jgi:hypothetical protein